MHHPQHALLQSSLRVFNPPLQHYSIMPSQPLVSGLNSHHNSITSVLATPSSLQESQEPRHQSKVKPLIEDKLKGATHHVDPTTSDGILHANHRTMKAVINNLGAMFQTLLTEGKTSTTDPQFPHHCFIITDGGMPSPGELLESILHGIIGK